MFRVFNMGIGMTLIVSPYYADSVVRMLEQSGHEAMAIGSVKACDGERNVQVV